MDIKEIIREAVAEFALGKEFSAEHPADEKMGDFATNAALVLSKELGRNPRELALDLVVKLQGNRKFMGLVEKIEPAGPGFINIYLKDKYLLGQMDEVLALDMLVVGLSRVSIQ